MTTENDTAAPPSDQTISAPAAPASAPPASPPASGEPAAAPASAAPAAETAPTSALDAVKRVMEKDQARAASAAGAVTAPAKPAAPAAAPAAAASPAAQPGDDRLTKEEFDALPPKAKARFNSLYRAQKTAETALATLTPKGQAFDDLQRWASNSGISQDEFTFGLQLMAAVRGDPARAWEMLQQQILPGLRRFVGEDLPEDLVAEVASGAMSKERAQELARERATRAKLEADGRARTEADTQARAAAQVRAVNADLTNTIKGYEDQWKASDPDYSKKAQRTWERMMAIMQTEGVPKTRDAAITVMKRARNDVESWMRGLLPAAKPKAILPAGGNGAQTRQEPASALDAARLGLARVRAA